MEEKFSMFIPFEIEKSSKTGEERYQDMRIKGIASNPNTGNDRQGQWLDPSGFQLDDFLSTGSLNFHHLWKDKPSAIIGEPIKAHITKSNELYVEGKLYANSKLAREVYDLAEVLEKDSKTRRLGFSIEGIPTLKDPLDENRILKARITNLAITPSPVCKGTRMDIMKGGFDDIAFEVEEGSEFLIDITEGDYRYTVDKNLHIEKAMVAGDITGRETTDQSLTQEPLKKESIDLKKKKKKKVTTDCNASMTKGQVFLKLIDEHGLDLESCERVYNLMDKINSSQKN